MGRFFGQVPRRARGASLAETSSGGYTDTVRSPRWLQVPLALSLGVVVLASSSVAFAQASALASPYPPSASASASASASPSASASAATATAPPTPTVAPPEYSDVAIPAPPGSAGVYAAPRGAVALAVDSPDLHIGTSIATRLRALDADLQILAMRGGGDYFGPIVNLLLAGGLIGLGIWADTTGSLSMGSQWYPAYMYTSAAGMVARSVLSFVLASMNNPSGSAIRYAHMPMGSRSEVRARLQYGESQLDALADLARIGRIADGSLSIVVGLAVVPIMFGSGSFDTSNFFGWILLGTSAIQVVTGIISLVSTTEAERRQSAYHELRDRILSTPEGMSDEDALEQAEADASARSDVTVTPMFSLGPTGGFAGATLTF